MLILWGNYYLMHKQTEINTYTYIDEGKPMMGVYQHVIGCGTRRCHTPPHAPSHSAKQCHSAAVRVGLCARGLWTSGDLYLWFDANGMLMSVEDSQCK